jgi:D-alanyl-D-alanine carboxypeptidase
MGTILQKSGTVATGLLAILLLLPGCSQDKFPSAAAETCDRAKQVLTAGKEEFGFPGAVGAINFETGEECEFAIGLSDVDDQVPMRPDHRFLAASIGKTFVAAEVMRLAYAGTLDIDDKVGMWLGEHEGYERIPNADEMTIRHLLSHTAGIPDHVYQPALAGDWSVLTSKDSAIPPWRLVGYIFDTEPLFEPGAGFAYSDTGYILLGLIIEKASGQPFYDLVERDFLVPLKLDRTAPTSAPRLPGLAQAYIEGERIEMSQKETIDADGYLRYNAASEWTGGGFVSNPRDLARWVKAYFSGQSMPYDYLERVLEGAPHLDTAANKGYGLGVSKYTTEFGVAYGHFGWIPGYVSAAFYLPERGVSYSFSINTDINLMGGPDSNFSRLHDRVVESIFDIQ